MTAKPVRFGPFYLDARIAVGGTAEVFLAHPAEVGGPFPDRLVVKRLLPHFGADTEGRTMFDREARLHACVHHENVVSVFGAGTDEQGEPYLAMEYIEGADLYRLLRALRQDGDALSPGVSVYVAREVLRALASVHEARGEAGDRLDIVHRDVSPSNIYLSRTGGVKLGDFGIARSLVGPASTGAQVLSGKFSYFAPEQVAGEPADQRADLFSLAVVLAEMLLGRPLFPGTGQLAVLLQIRDCRTDLLDAARDDLPVGLYEVLKRGLSCSAAERFPSALAFNEALSPFEADPAMARRDLAAGVKRVERLGSADGIKAVHQSVQAMRAVAAPPPREQGRADSPPPDSGNTTGQYALAPSLVEFKDGTRGGPYTFAKLVELLATGAIGRGDRIDYLGGGMRDIESIEDLARFVAPVTGTKGHTLSDPDGPTWTQDLGTVGMLDVLLHLVADRATGALVVEHEADPRAEVGETPGRKELFFLHGKLHHVASSDATELLGEYLVRRGKLAREELDLALAVLPRYGGRMGDTLIALGLIGPVGVFRAIRDQGRDRVADTFRWRRGKASFYDARKPEHVEFPLDLDLPTILLSGLAVQHPDGDAFESFGLPLGARIRTGDGHVAGTRRTTTDVVWPPSVSRVLATATDGTTVGEILEATFGERRPPGHKADLVRGQRRDVLLALKLLFAAGLLVRERAT